ERTPERPLRQIDVLPEAERHRVLVEWNATAAAYPQDTCVHELFEAQAERTPAAVAVVHEERHLSYAELNTQANRLAHHLRGLGVRPDDRVAICIERSPEMIVGLLAILKAGGAYVPLDPAYPSERLAFMVRDSAPVALLVGGGALSVAGAVLAENGVPVLDIGVDAAQWADAPAHDPERSEVGLAASHLAYVIYTSGSTGQPKGVMVEHCGLANLVHWHCAAFNLQAETRSSLVAGSGFDAATWETWPPLCCGGTLAVPRPKIARDPEALLAWWQTQPLDVSFLPTPIAEFAFSQGATNPHLRFLLTGGDRLRKCPKDLPFSLVNNYGPTETTVVATSGLLDPAGEVLHIGRPIANTRIYILDEHGEPVPIGVAGELYIGGAGVARGYLNRPELTAERFVEDRFSGEAGARLYRTGDLGRWLGDGTIAYLGRNDFQVKIRGFRIELGEIEARLSEHAGVRDVAVIAREDGPGDKRLVAYYVSDVAIVAEELRGHLAARLPDYMVPPAYVHLERLPLTPNGKLDRKALPAPEGAAFAVQAYEPPQGKIEEELARIWEELLGVERVGRHDNFFALGGHSLLVVSLAERIDRQFDLRIGLAAVFSNERLHQLAELILNSQLVQFDVAELLALRTQTVALRNE
ncbi:MAG: non-ribosomal peptide synthetase, partial [Bradyrhizobium sp.]|uniref:non-ribosomal peptide synthetase n=1 Tax=Bradyrhizobium sp. TaxID=376 RepID=UPI00391DF973